MKNLPPRDIGPIQGVVLAGGLSTRMGTDKRFLKTAGTTWVDRAIRRLAAALRTAPSDIIISGALEGYRSVPDLKPGMGPLGGVISSLQHLERTPHRWVLFTPVDMPLLSITALRTLIGAAEQEPVRGAQVIRYAGSELPFLLRNSGRARAIAEGIRRGKSVSLALWRFQRALELKTIDPAGLFPPETFFNANSPGDIP